MVDDLRDFARQHHIEIPPQDAIAEEAAERIAAKYQGDADYIRRNFDMLVDETEQETYAVYLEHEERYTRMVLTHLVEHLRQTGRITAVSDVAPAIADHHHALDRFYLSLSQSRRSRAGRSFEAIQRSLFRRLGYPFTEQPLLNGKPDFVMPSAEHYATNPMDCIIYTSKRTLRERWRQIVTEGAKGYGFFLATIDDKISTNQLQEMLNQRIYVVLPARIRDEVPHYAEAPNVLSFRQFFLDQLDPSVERWRRNGVI
jgi:hypothetical protein